LNLKTISEGGSRQNDDPEDVSCNDGIHNNHGQNLREDLQRSFWWRQDQHDHVTAMAGDGRGIRIFEILRSICN
jgi:hypothetical protein